MSDNRISLTEADVCTIARSDDSLALEACWMKLRGGALMPARRAVTASVIPKRLLAGIGICSVEKTHSGHEGTYRLAGTRFRRLTGIELTGNRPEQVFADGNLNARRELLRAVLEAPVGVWWVSNALIGTEYSCLYQSTIFPLRSEDTGKVDHFLHFVECEIPIIAQDRPSIISSHILKHLWIDIGAGTPPE